MARCLTYELLHTPWNVFVTSSRAACSRGRGLGGAVCRWCARNQASRIGRCNPDRTLREPEITPSPSGLTGELRTGSGTRRFAGVQDRVAADVHIAATFPLTSRKAVVKFLEQVSQVE
jgi:hypothetical protein